MLTALGLERRMQTVYIAHKLKATYIVLCRNKAGGFVVMRPTAGS